MSNAIPNHLWPFIMAAIRSGLTDPEKILQHAIEKCDALMIELNENQTQRAQLARAIMAHQVYSELRPDAPADALLADVQAIAARHVRDDL